MGILVRNTYQMDRNQKQVTLSMVTSTHKFHSGNRVTQKRPLCSSSVDCPMYVKSLTKNPDSKAFTDGLLVSEVS